MTDLEERLRVLLEERAKDYLADPMMPRGVATRSRRRRALAGAGAGLGVVAAIVLGAAALRATAPPDDAASPSPSPVVEPWRGIWPQTTREEGEAAQAAADAGESSATWQLDAVEVVRRFAHQELGFAQVYFDESLDIAEEDSPGPFTIHAISCEPRDTIEWPPICSERGDHLYAAVTIRRLVREDRTGVWFVTRATEPQPAGVSSDAEPPPGEPASFVGLRDGDVVLADAATGATIRVLADRSVVGGVPGEIGPVDLVVSPDGADVYFVPVGSERVLRVPTSGGPAEAVAEGRDPAISSNGRYLAYVTCASDIGLCGAGIEILDLTTGRVRSWEMGFSDQWAGSLAWVPDDRNLAFSISYPGDSNPTLHVLDTVDGAGVLLRDIEPIGPDRVGEGWTAIGFHVPTDGLVVDQYCCTTYATDPVEEAAVLSISWINGQVITALLDGDWMDVEIDAVGRHFLVLDPSGDVYRFDADGEPVFVASGFEDVDW